MEGKDGFNVLSEAKTWLEEHGATVLMPMDVPDASWDGPDNDLYRKVDLVISVGEQGVFHYTSHAFDKLIKIIPKSLGKATEQIKTNIFCFFILTNSTNIKC